MQEFSRNGIVGSDILLVGNPFFYDAFVEVLSTNIIDSFKSFMKSEKFHEESSNSWYFN